MGKNFFFKINFSNPVLIYLLIWLTTLYIYNLELTKNIKGLNEKTSLLIYSSCIIFLILYFILVLIRHELKKNKFDIKIKIQNINNDFVILKFKKVIKLIFKIWLFFSVLEILIFKGVPLISVVLLRQTDLDYAKFGIPTVHGLLNALFYTFLSGYFILYNLTKKKEYLFFAFIFLLWPILLMSRASLLWAISEILCIHLLFNKITFKKISKIILYVLLFIYLFGVLGDARIGEDSTFKASNFINTKYESYEKYIPSGFIWVYLYATTPINNLVSQTEQINPSYNFRSTTEGLIPSFIRTKIYSEDEKYGFELEDSAFNVSSYFTNYLNDFGINGSILFVSILMILILLIYNNCTSGKIGSIIAYSAVFYAILTSIFFNNFLSLVTVFQVILGYYINNFLYKNKKLNYNVQK